MIEDIVPFAETNFRNQRSRFGIKTDDRRRHMYVVGKTGMGKTNMIQNMVIEDIRTGKGLAIIDPHGEFAETILEYIPEERIEDVIYFNPADLHYPIAFNVMENVAPEYRHLVSDGLVAIFHKLWSESWGPRLEYVLRNTILALLEVPDSTLLGIMRMLVDKSYRKWVIVQLKDPVIRSFWVEEFSKYPDRFATEAVAPIQNKVGQFLANPLIRNIVGQTNISFNIRESMDARKIFIVNLSKGRIGEGTSRLLGAMMITKFQLAAMSRIDTPENERDDFYLYVDEFQNFATEAFAGILSEARKYRLNLTLAHQYIAQLEDGASTVVRDAVFGNVGTMVSFRVGAADAEYLEKEFEPQFMMNDLVNLTKYNIYLKLMIDGVSSRAFSAVTLPPLELPERSFREQVIDNSRKSYGRPREQVEEEIREWAGPIESPEGEEAAGLGGKTSKRDLWTTECSICGIDVQVPFQPDGLRPVYCDEHHKAVQSGEIARARPKSTRSARPDGAVGRGGPGQGSPSHKATDGQGPPSHKATDGQGPPSHKATDGQGSPSHKATDGQGSPSHKALVEQGTTSPRADRSRGRHPSPKPPEDEKPRQMGPQDQGVVTKVPPKETISLGSLPSREEKTIKPPTPLKSANPPSHKATDGQGPPSHKATDGQGPPSHKATDGHSKASISESGDTADDESKANASDRPRPPKVPRPKKERQEPDLSGLRDILEEVMDEEGIDHDLDKRIEEESVNDILGK